ncbi:MAG: hypothetical protein M0Z44_04130 [Gammaproteobacteria bacterium]|nr:hypothetical protein [Gammaproteobacteria bacterium]
MSTEGVPTYTPNTTSTPAPIGQCAVDTGDCQPLSTKRRHRPRSGRGWRRGQLRDGPGNTIDTVLFTDGLKRVIQTKKTAAVATNTTGGSTDDLVVSGDLAFDAFGRAIDRWYPATEAAGTGNEETFDPALDPVTPTVTTYDVLNRPLAITLPDDTTTRYTYGFGPN